MIRTTTTIAFVLLSLLGCAGSGGQDKTVKAPPAPNRPPPVPPARSESINSDLQAAARETIQQAAPATLARVREAGGLRSAALLESIKDTTFGTTTVDAITLFESRLSPKGPNYVALQRTGLRGVRLQPTGLRGVRLQPDNPS